MKISQWLLFDDFALRRDEGGHDDVLETSIEDFKAVGAANHHQHIAIGLIPRLLDVAGNDIRDMLAKFIEFITDEVAVEHEMLDVIAALTEVIPAHDAIDFKAAR